VGGTFWESRGEAFSFQMNAAVKQRLCSFPRGVQVRNRMGRNLKNQVDKEQGSVLGARAGGVISEVLEVTKEVPPRKMSKSHGSV